MQHMVNVDLNKNTKLKYSFLNIHCNVQCATNKAEDFNLFCIHKNSEVFVVTELAFFHDKIKYFNLPDYYLVDSRWL